MLLPGLVEFAFQAVSFCLPLVAKDGWATAALPIAGPLFAFALVASFGWHVAASLRLLRRYRLALNNAVSDEGRFAARWLATALITFAFLWSVWGVFLLWDWLWPLGYTGLMWLYLLIAAVALFLAFFGNETTHWTDGPHKRGVNRRTLLAGIVAMPLFANPARVLAERPAASAADDVAVLRAAMTIHPGLCRYLTPRGVERSFAAFEHDYLAGMRRGSLDVCYLALSRFLTTLRCGHSYPNFFNQTDPAVKALFDRPTRLPFAFEWLGGEMVVTADHSGTGVLPRGTRITAVNGGSTARMLDRLMPYTRADGHNDGKRRSLLGVRGAEDIEYFDVFQGLLMPPAGGVHHIVAARPDGRETRLEVPAIGLAARRATMTRVRETSDEARWSYAVRADGVAVLDMPGWAMWNSRWDWRSWLSDRLDDAAHTRGLVIDLRRNEGGDDCGDPILARLIDRDLAGWPFTPKVRFREVPASLAPHVTTWDDRFRRLGVGGEDLGGGWFALPEREALAPIRPDAKRLRVPVAALIGPANSSATFGFANAVRKSGRIRLFGEPTGGNRRGINGGGFFFTKLPGSGIEFDLPLIGYFPDKPQPDAGIAPDVSVLTTAAAIAAGADPALEAAAVWARNTREN